MDGFFVIDKPAGLTSHDIVSFARKQLNTKRVGHTGTLDPFATGVLPIAVGRGAKAIQFLDENEKEYRAVMRLGISTDTQDHTGITLCEKASGHVSAMDIRKIFTRFTGRISQIPPMYSAVKIGGVPLYKQARKGIEIDRPARSLVIFSLDLESLQPPFVSFSVRCSKGTYVRTLASDIGDALGCGAHLTELRRTQSGPFMASAAITLETLAEMAAERCLDSCLLSPYDALSNLKDIQLDETGKTKVFNGVIPDASHVLGFAGQEELLQGERFRLSRGTKLLAVAEHTGAKSAYSTQNARLLRVFT